MRCFSYKLHQHPATWRKIAYFISSNLFQVSTYDMFLHLLSHMLLFETLVVKLCLLVCTTINLWYHIIVRNTQTFVIVTIMIIVTSHVCLNREENFFLLYTHVTLGVIYSIYSLHVPLRV